MKRFVHCVLGLGLVGTTAFGREIGLPIGTTVPDFTRFDQNGKARDVKSWLGPKGGVILFVRSADWCPYCKSQLVDLEKNTADFQKLGLGIAGVSYDKLSVVREFAEKRGIHFPILSDPDAKVIKLFAVLNEGVPKGDQFYGSSYPCLFVLNEKSVVVAKYFEEDPRLTKIIPDILAQRFNVSPSIRQAKADAMQLKFVATASHSMVTAGQRVSITLDIEMKPNMHLYGKNGQRYIPVAWIVNKSDAVADYKVSYPRSEDVYLEAIDETVSVYQGRFRFRGVITLSEDAALKRVVDSQGNFNVQSVLNYQACDDQTCYLPQHAPMNWSFHYVGFDRKETP